HFQDKRPYYPRPGGTWSHKKGKPHASFCPTRCTPANISRMHLVPEILALLLCLSPPVLAQEQNGASASSTTRSGQIQAERIEKAAHLAPEKLTSGEKDLTGVKHTFERLFQEGNPHLQLGGLPSGSGFAIGPTFQWSNSTDSVRAGFFAVGSVSQYYRVG